ncbi:MAG: hypothetical protein GX220_03270 [Treponema sp.]|nr:hypothetical protein [Treponema sp.]
MKSIIKFIFLTVFIFLFANAFTLDYGGTLSNSTGIKGAFNALELDQNNKATLWLKSPFNESQNMYFAAEGSYKFSYTGGNNNIITNELELGLFKFSMILPMENNSRIRLDIGRISAFDTTSLIFAQSSDGAQFAISTPKFVCSVLASYTGLLSAHSYTYFGYNYTYNNNILYPLAQKFFIVDALIKLPTLFAKQDLTAEFLGFFSGEKAVSDYHRMYATLGLNGGIAKNLFYIFSTTFGFNTSNDPYKGFSNLSNFELSYYPSFMSSSFAWITTYASGNSDNGLKRFMPFNKIAPDISGHKAYSGLFKTGFMATIQPITNFLLVAATDLFFISDPESGTSFGLDGFQWSFNARWQILSDIQLSLIAGQFLPLINSTSDADFFATLKLVISF